MSKETASFKAFLHDEFQREIADSKAVYLLIPSGECEQCRASSLPTPDFFERTGCILISSMVKVKKQYPGSLLDYNNRLSSLTFIDYRPKVVITSAGSIRAILEYRDGMNLDSLAGKY